MESLSKRFLGYTAIKELPPPSNECLTALTLLDLRGCKNLKCLPSRGRARGGGYLAPLTLLKSPMGLCSFLKCFS